MTLDTKSIESIREILPLAESFCKSVLHHLKTTTNLQEVPITVKKQLDFDENRISESYIFVSLYSGFLQQKCPLPVMAEFEESRPLIRGLIDAGILRIQSVYDNEGNSVNPTFDNNFLWLLNKFHHLIIEYLKTEKVLDYHSDKFTVLFKSWAKDQITPTWHEVIIPLTGFNSSINQIELIDGFKIYKFSNHSKSELFNRLENISFFYGNTDLSKFTHCLTANSKENSDDQKNIEQLTEDAEDIITGLRLVQEGLIGAGAAFFFKHPRRKYGLKMLSSRMDTFNIVTQINIEGKYKFLDTDIGSLIEIVGYLKKVRREHNKYLNIALRRFNLSYTRNLLEDRLIDLTISLESTMLAEERDELKYRLALRGSFLLRNICPPEETNRILKKMYDVRSKVVHSGETINDSLKKDKSHSCENFLSQVGNVTRKILKEYVTLSASGRSVTSVNQDIEKQLLELMSVVEKPEE